MKKEDAKESENNKEEERKEIKIRSIKEGGHKKIEKERKRK